MLKSLRGVEGAYECLADKQALKILANGAIAARNVAQLQACAVIETFVHGRALTGGLYMALAMLLTGPAARLPDGFASQLRALAAQADTVERDSATAEFETAIMSFPIDAVAADHLRWALGLLDHKLD
jgi:hypothetical protein